MKYLFLPFEQHSDFGFGEVARSFQESAERLALDAHNKPLMNSQFPVNYLYRHSIELYLKSCIINIHRYLNNGSIKVSDIRIGEKQQLISNMHSIKSLFQHFRGLVVDNKAIIEIEKRTKWSEIPGELSAFIEDIESYDSRSTYFRYPGLDLTQVELEKSSMKEVDSKDLQGMVESGNKIFTYVEVNDKNEIEKAYILDRAVLGKCQESLKEVAGILSGASVGIRMELANGE